MPQQVQKSTKHLQHLSTGFSTLNINCLQPDAVQCLTEVPLSVFWVPAAYTVIDLTTLPACTPVTYDPVNCL